MRPIRPLQYSQFCKYMTDIKNIIQLQDETDNAIRRYNGQAKSLANIQYPTLIDDVIGLLKWATSDLDNWIGYYIFELDFGKKYKDGCVTNPDGSIVKLKTIEDLWTLLKDEYSDAEEQEINNEQNSKI